MKKVSPFTVGVLAMLVIGLIMQLPFDEILQEKSFSLFQIEYIPLTLKMSLIFLVGTLGIRTLETKSLSGLSSNYKWTSKPLNLIPGYLFLIGIATFVGKDLSTINISNLILLLLACLSVGFAEEFMFRGFLQPLFIRRYVLKKNGLFLGILFPSLFFGASHLLNLTVNDNVPQVIVQAIYATFIGFFFGVLLLKTNKLLPIAITHALINFFFLFNTLPGLNDFRDTNTEPQSNMTLLEQISESAIPLIMFIPLFVIGLFILRKIEKEQILTKLDK